jgi:hypothetical protein
MYMYIGVSEQGLGEDELLELPVYASLSDIYIASFWTR